MRIDAHVNGNSMGIEAEAVLFEPYIVFYECLLDRIGLSTELREQVNRGNARHLFGLDPGG